MKKTVVFILLAIFYSCYPYSSKDDSYEVIDVAASLTQVQEISMEDLGQCISYVPLETTDESLIGKRAYVRLLRDRLLVGSFQQPIKMFDKKTGKFIRIIGDIGLGSNEYTLQDGIPIFWTDDVTEIIYVQTEGNIVLRFDINGNPLKNICLPDSFPILKTVSQTTLENKLYTYKQTLFDKNDYKIFVYDIHEKHIHNFFLNEDEVLPLDFSQTPLVLVGVENIPISPSCVIFTWKDGRMALSRTENPCFWVFDKKIYFKENFNDTIYCIENYRLNPRLVFNLGDKHFDYKDRFNVEGSKNKIVINYILEGKRSILFAFQTDYFNLKNAKTYLGIYDKSNKSVKIANHHINDFKNVSFIEKLQTTTSEGKFLGLIETAFFVQNTCTENLFGISEEDNPIVVIVE